MTNNTKQRRKQDEETKLLILKQGGKRALKEFNSLHRAKTTMPTGTRTHDDRREKVRHKPNLLDTRFWA